MIRSLQTCTCTSIRSLRPYELRIDPGRRHNRYRVSIQFLEEWIFANIGWVPTREKRGVIHALARDQQHPDVSFELLEVPYHGMNCGIMAFDQGKSSGLHQL